MRLLVGIDGKDVMVHKTFISSFLIYGYSSLPVVLGIEYILPEGIVRTFSDSTSADFHAVLHRSGIAQTVPAEFMPGIFRLFYMPFLGKGVPEWIANVSRVLVINDHGKHLFAACRNEAGAFVTKVYADHDFENFVAAFF